MLDECREVISADSWQTLRLLFIDEQDPLHELYLMQQIDFGRYDYIFCSAFYYDVIDRFMPWLKGHFFNINIGLTDLKLLIAGLLYPSHQNDNTCRTDSRYWQRFSLSSTEVAVVKHYLALMGAKDTSVTMQSTVKLISGHKRRAMAKLHCDTNQEFWLTLQFLIFFGNNRVSDLLS